MQGSIRTLYDGDLNLSETLSPSKAMAQPHKEHRSEESSISKHTRFYSLAYSAMALLNGSHG